jgi:hypothetical protein
MAVVDACLGGVRIARPAGATLDLNFMTGSLGAGAVFTRAGPGWYTNSSGTLVSAAIDTPRFDYDPVTLQLKGVLLEEAKTNLILQSGNLANASWGVFGNVSAAPTVTANNANAPDGTLTAARIVFPAVSAANAYSQLQQNFTATATPYAISIWLRGNAGGEQLYLLTSPDGAFFYRSRLTLTAAWQRFTFTSPALTAVSWAFGLGTDLRDGGQTSTAGGTIFAWGAQIETNYASSYIPTTTVTVTRASDALRYPIASVTGFSPTTGTLAHEYILEGVNSAFNAAAQLVGASTLDWIDVDRTSAGSPLALVTWADIGIGATVVGSATYDGSIALPAGPVHRGASAWATGTVMRGAHDGAPTTSSSGNVSSLPVITNLTVGGPMASQNAMSQWARRTRYWPRQLTQAELIAATS